MDDRTVKINLRIPQHLLDRIDQQSVKYRRSRNSEILACIEFATEYHDIAR
ncbi:MAG: Arc family DNA-binding protein [Acidimicrobiia bacterium]